MSKARLMKILDGGGKKKAKSMVPVSGDVGMSGTSASASPAVVLGTTTQLIRVEDVPRWRAPRGSRKGSRKAKPVPDLHTPRGDYVWSNESVPANPKRSSRTGNEPSPLAGDAVEREVLETQSGDAFPQNEDHFATSQTLYLDHSQVKPQDRVKKERQWRVWEETIPGLVDPYLELVERTTSLRKRPDAGEPWTCECVTRKLVVMCVYFDRIEEDTLQICKCCPASLQLVRKGLFPCAPVHPSMAVDIGLLDFVRALFVRAAPNVTAWCGALEASLGKKSFKLDWKDSLRQRFGRSLQWYTALVNAADAKVIKIVDDARLARIKNSRLRTDKGAEPSVNIPDPITSLADTSARLSLPADATAAFSEEPASLPSSSALPVPPGGSESTSDSTQQPDDEDELQDPSLYLQKACPACFAPHVFQKMAESGFEGPQVIAMMDGCFTQKRRRTAGGQHDAPRVHPQSCFLPDEAVAEAERLVEKLRPTKGKAGHEAPSTPDEDKVEPGMKIPNSVLDTCHESFKAADEKRVKASTKYFADTGLMGMVCRHDRVIWLVNMTSAGEKQYYALALVFELLKHLPKRATIGLLYDIACQLERSCRKFGFLGEDLHRFLFALAVFHAYGHEWACQLLYHPRKVFGFGLSDGEGCERTWAMLQPLIASLRVSGYFQRKMVLDVQIQYHREQSLGQMAAWLVKKYGKAVTKQAEIQEEQEDLLRRHDGVSISDEELREEHRKQVQAQTKPLPRADQNLAKNTIDLVLQLQRTIDKIVEELSVLDTKAMETTTLHVLSGIQAQREVLSTTLRHYQGRQDGAMHRLGVQDKINLEALKKDEFVKARVKAFALLTRIRKRMRDRRFENDRLERSFRTTSNEQNLQMHIGAALAKRQGTTTSLARDYNTLCTKMKGLIAKSQAPAGAVAPLEIDVKGLFKMDVDHGIWTNLGFDDDISDEVPRWLGDEQVRDGIRYLLELDRCKEELVRLSWERCALQEWFTAEWEAVQDAKNQVHSPALMYQLQQCETRLVDLLVEWRPFITRIQPAYNIKKPWGPPWLLEKARRKAKFTADTVSVDAMHVDQETGPDPVVLSDAEEEDDEYYEGAEEDAKVMEELEIVGEQEEYVVEANGLEELTLPVQRWLYSEAAATPRKRHRTHK